MSIQLGSAFGRISIEAKDAISMTEKVAKSLGGLGKPAALGIGAITAAGAVASGALVALGASSLGVAKEFESSLAILSTALDPSSLGLDSAAAAMDVMSDTALKVGGDTALLGVSASSAAESITGLYKAGLTTNEIFGDLQGYLAGTTELSGALRASIDLAAASELDMVQASELAAVTLATFGGELTTTEQRAEFVNTAMDNFVKTADASVASVQDLADAFANVGPTANALGMGVEDVNTALGILSMRGITGANAGTALKSMLTNLMRDTPDVTQALKDLNISLYDMEGNMRSLPDIMAQLETGLSRMTEEQRNQYVATIAGTYGMNAMNSLLAEGASGWALMEQSVARASSMQEVATARTNTLAGAQEQLEGVVESFRIKVGTALIPAVKKAADSGGELVEIYGPPMVGVFEALGLSLEEIIDLLNDPTIQHGLIRLGEDLQKVADGAGRVAESVVEYLAGLGAEREIERLTGALGLTTKQLNDIDRQIADSVGGWANWANLGSKRSIMFLEILQQEYGEAIALTNAYQGLAEASGDFDWEDRARSHQANQVAIASHAMAVSDWGDDVDEARRMARLFGLDLEDTTTVIQAARVATTEYATDTGMWGDITEVARVKALEFGEAIGYDAEQADRAAESLAAFTAAYQGVIQSGDYTTKLPGADQPLVSPAKVVTTVTGGPTKEQSDLIKTYQQNIERLETSVYNLTNGIGTYGMEQEKVNKRVEEAQGEIDHYRALMAPLVGIVGETSTSHQGMAVNVKAAEQAIFDQLVAMGAAPELISAYGVAIGVMTQDQADAALAAALLQIKIGELATEMSEAIKEGDRSVQEIVAEGRQNLLDYAEDLVTVGEELPNALGQGVLDNKDAAIDAIDTAAQDVIDAANAAFEIHSPSQVFLGMGDNLGTSLVDGFSDKIDDARSTLESIGRRVIDGVNAGIEAAKASLSGILSEVAGLIPDWLREFLGIASPAAELIPVGVSITEGIIEGIRLRVAEALENDEIVDLIDEMLSSAQTFSGLASGFGNRFFDQAIAPLEGQIDALGGQIGAYDEALGSLGTALNLDPTSADFYHDLFWMTKRGTAEQQHLAHIAMSVYEDRADLMADMAETQAELVAQEEKLLRLETQRADLDFLQQQYELIKLIRDNKLDTAILDGLTTGVDADAEAWMDAMIDATQAMIAAVEDELGIHSPSEVFRQIGRQVKAGLMLEIADTRSLVTATRGMVNDVISGADGAVQQSITDASRTIQVFGGITAVIQQPRRGWLDDVQELLQPT